MSFNSSGVPQHDRVELTIWRHGGQPDVVHLFAAEPAEDEAAVGGPAGIADLADQRGRAPPLSEMMRASAWPTVERLLDAEARLRYRPVQPDAPSVPPRNTLLEALGRAATGSPGSWLARRRDLRRPGRPRPCQHLRSAGSRGRPWRLSAAAALTRNSAWLCTGGVRSGVRHRRRWPCVGEGAEWIGRTDSAATGEIGAAVRLIEQRRTPARREPPP